MEFFEVEGAGRNETNSRTGRSTDDCSFYNNRYQCIYVYIILLLLTISVAIAIVLDISVFSKRKFNVNLDAIFDSIVSWVDIHNVINFII